MYLRKKRKVKRKISDVAPSLATESLCQKFEVSEQTYAKWEDKITEYWKMILQCAKHGKKQKLTHPY